MPEKKKVAAICGSTKQSSLNLSLIHAIAALTANELDINIFNGIADLPQFNPDLDNANPPGQVAAFRQLLRNADGILICTPEYAMGVPGTLKNAIDWTVSSCEFSHKPVALITASSQGFKGHKALMETLMIIESDITEDTQLVISYVKTKVSQQHAITDPATEQSVMALLRSFMDLMAKERANIEEA